MTSFRGQLALAMGVLIVVISLAMWIYLPRALEREAEALAGNKAESVARLTAFTIHPALYFQDRSALEEALSGTRRDPDVAYITVTAPDGSTLAAYQPERSTGGTGLSAERSMYEVALPIRDGERLLATLRIGMSLARLRQEIARMRIAIGILIAVLSIAGVIAVVLMSNFLSSLRNISKRLLSVQEEERVRIAREVHDELGQALTALKIDLQQIGSSHEEIAQPLRGVARNIDHIVDLVRRIATDLRPAILDDLGITAALEQQLRRLREATGIETTLRVAEEPELDGLTRVTLYRIAQEALANVVRHSHATAVEISLSVGGGTAVLEIRDNGKGIGEHEIASARSLGVVGIRERAELLAGSVHIEGRAGKGTVVTVRLPVIRSERDAASTVR